MPSFGIEDVDYNSAMPSINIGLSKLKLSDAPSSAVKFQGSLKRAIQLTQSEGSDKSMDTDEENDKVMYMSDDLNTFRQVDYLWLFDNHLKFSERDDFKVRFDDLNVTAEDFLQMREINRRLLTDFCKTTQKEDIALDGENPEHEMEEEEKGTWADENLDEELKAFLSDKENGRDTPIDIVSHLEYFYNTLDCNFSTKNPFDHPLNFPVLLYRGPTSSADSSNASPLDEKTLFEKHRALIFPKTLSPESKSNNSSDVSPCGAALLHVNHQFSVNTCGGSQGSHLSAILLPKKYKWYPNMNIGTPKCSRISISPSPKNFSTFLRRGSAAVPNNPYTRVSGQFQIIP